MNIVGIEELSRGDECRRERVVYRSSMADFLGHIRSEALRHGSLYHYTQWGNLVKMMTPVSDDSECNGHRVMLLSRATAMNDRTEKGWGKNVYFTCFSYSKYEDVAMWMNYGRRSPDAVRVRFDGRTVGGWYSSHAETKDCVFSAKEKKDGGFSFRKIQPEDIESIEYADVAYVIHHKLMNHKHCGNVEYGRDFFIVRDGEDDGLAWSDDVYEGSPRRSLPDLPAYFKKRGWGYERETRLVVTLKPGVPTPKRIAIVFDDVFDRLDVVATENLRWGKQDYESINYELGEDSAGNALMKGPWYDSAYSTDEPVNGLNFSKVRLNSDYGREIDIISSYHKSPKQQLVEAEAYLKTQRSHDGRHITEDDRSFLRPLSVDLKYAARTINQHIDRGDFTPNKYKLARLELLDIKRLASLARNWSPAADLLDRFREIVKSSESNWKSRVNHVERYK